MHDVVIVGAGPAGLTAGMYCARAGRKTLVLGNIYGSQQSMGGLYENYPGFPDGIQGIELSERMLQQAKKFGAENQPENASKVVSLGNLFRIKTESWQYEARALILAMGSSHRKLGVPGEEKYAGKGVSYCVHCDGALFKGKAVAVVGRGNGVARGGLYLANLAEKVHLLNTETKLSAESTYIDRLKGLSNVAVVNGADVTGINGDDLVLGVEFNVGGTPRSVKVSGVFVEIGMKPNVELAQDLGVELTQGGFVKVNRLNQETNILGVFAAGDITGGRMQVTTAVGSGASAAISANQYISSHA